MKNKRFVIYARKSTESADRQVLSIDAQVEEMQNVARNRGLTITKILKESQSASKLGRPVFAELMAAVESGKIDGILCWKPDRLARNPVDGARVQWAIKEGQMVLITYSIDYSRNSDNSLLLSLEFAFSEKYTDDLSRNVKRGNRLKLDRGGWPGVAPFGYLNKLDDHTVVPDPERFDKVKSLWDKRMQGSSIEGIRKHAKQIGLTTVRRKHIGGHPISSSMLYRMFQNPFYHGLIRRMHDGKSIEVQGLHIPMITKEEFLQVQGVLGDKSVPKTDRKPFSYTGMIKCGECGCMITAEEKKKPSGKRYVYYRCTKRKPDVTCSQKTIRVEQLESQITDCLSSLTIPDRFVKWAFEVLQVRNEAESATKTQRLAELQREYAMLDKQLDTLLDLRLQETIDDDTYNARKSNLEQRRERINESLGAVEADGDNWRSVCEKSFVFARDAQSTFEKGDMDTRRHIFKTIGSNFLLLNGNLVVGLKPHFQVIADKKLEAKRLELPILGLNETKKKPLVREISFWQGRRGSNPE